jgi:transcription elongation factor GreB
MRHSGLLVFIWPGRCCRLKSTRMSKAFTKETDGDEDGPDEADALPVDVKNYMTPKGFAVLQEELRQLMRVERPKVVEVVSWAAGNGDRSENGDYIYGKKRLREIDRRARYLTKRLEFAEVVDPAMQKNRDRVFFGATVTYARADDIEHTVTIVGVDEAELSQGKISWQSPIARALLKAQAGDTVEVRTPAGVEPIDVVTIRYAE